MDNVKLKENDELKNKYKDLKTLCKDEEEFEVLVYKLGLMEIVIGQLNDIYKSVLYAEGEEVLHAAADEATAELEKNITEQYINQSVAEKEIKDIPEFQIVLAWINQLHLNIAGQLFNADFVNEVMEPAFENIAKTVLEIGKEETEKVEEEEEETDENDN
jgi:hypothetical protein